MFSRMAYVLLGSLVLQKDRSCAWYCVVAMSTTAAVSVIGSTTTKPIDILFGLIAISRENGLLRSSIPRLPQADDET